MMLGRRFEVDFLRRPPLPPLAVWLLALGLVGSGLAAWSCIDAWHERAALALERAELDAALERARQAAQQRHSAARGAGPAAQAQAIEVLEALHRPWNALLDQLEAVHAPGVHLVQLAVDARFETLQLQAEARTLGDVLRYTEQLPAAGPIVAVRLTSHEVRDAPGGRVVSARLAAALGADRGAAAQASPPGAAQAVAGLAGAMRIEPAR
jgi:hypothetical protein